MATDTADDGTANDEKAVTPEGSSPMEPHVAPSTAGGPAQEPRKSSDWTASDARGPLVTAVEGQSAHVDGEPAASHDTSSGAQAAEAHSTEVHPVDVPVAEHPIPEGVPAPVLAEPVLAEPVAAEPAAAARTDAETEAEETSKRRSLWPVAAGLVIGAMIGAGSAAVVYGIYGPSGSAGGAPASDPQAVSLSARVDALEKRPDAQTMAGLKSAVADLDGKVAALQKSEGTPSASPVAPKPAPLVDLTPLQQKVAALQSSLDALKTESGDQLKTQSGGQKALEAKITALEGEVAGAKKESAAAQSSVANVASDQKLLTDKVLAPALAVVADSLVQQIDQGQPYKIQVDALATLGADPAKIAVLRENADKGVPSAKVLAAKFEPLAEPIIAGAHKAPPNAGFVDRLKSGMFSMVSVRSVDDTSGSDLPSRVARIKADLAHDDVADALATWEALPADSKPKGEAWGALAKTSAEAMSAARALQHDAITALGAKKS